MKDPAYHRDIIRDMVLRHSTTMPRRIDRVKAAHGKPFKIKGKNAWKDSKGRIWTWGAPHGGPHWDVNDPLTGKHQNIFPDGRERGVDPKPSDGASRSTQIVGGITLLGMAWWGAKVLSPFCGPAAPACAVVL